MELQREVFRKELDALFKALPVPLFMSWFNSMFLAALLHNRIDADYLYFWIIASTVITLLRYLAYFHYRRHNENLLKSHLLYTSGLTASALLWGTSVFYLLPESQIYGMIVIFVAGGMAAGALGSVSYRFESYLLYNLIILIPFILILLLHPTFEYRIMGFILILFSAMLLISSRKFYTQFNNALTLQIEQQKLAESISAEKQMTEQLNHHLSNEIIEKEVIHNHLIQALAEAEQAAIAKDAFFATMSHELRTPLNAIIGFSQILLRKQEMPSQFVTYMEKILISGNHLLTLVNSILDFSKMRSGKMELNRSTFLLSELFQELSVITEPLAEKQNLHIHFSNPGRATIVADRKLLYQILLNLLSNAIKFSPSGTTITVTHTLNNEHLFSVCDQGKGISPEFLQTIFDPFVQIDRKSSEHQGTGLGLAIVKEMVQAHGGEVWAESQIEEGSCFYIAIPLIAE
ncbi:MAG: HAMP domain-containing sensor histidine kinase [Sulfuricurvum sp.]|nr:HAMP domain-containing sensor histidine kinase [Sulfuricurvum sp.]